MVTQPVNPIYVIDQPKTLSQIEAEQFFQAREAAAAKQAAFFQARELQAQNTAQPITIPATIGLFDAFFLDLLQEPVDTAAFLNLNFLITDVFDQEFPGTGSGTTNELDRLLLSELILTGALFNPFNEVDILA